MVIAGTQPDRRSDRRWPVEEGTDQPRDHAYVYALVDDEAYLQTDEAAAKIEEPPLDLASIFCSFCGKSEERVAAIFASQRPVRDPNTGASIARVYICNECIAVCIAVMGGTPAQGTRGPRPQLPSSPSAPVSVGGQDEAPPQDHPESAQPVMFKGGRLASSVATSRSIAGAPRTSLE
jgi:hypothetical protein